MLRPQQSCVWQNVRRRSPLESRAEPVPLRSQRRLQIRLLSAHLHQLAPSAARLNRAAARQTPTTKVRHRSPEEACLRVCVNQRHELLNRHDLRHWIIDVPLQVTTLPKHSPSVDSSHIRSLRHCAFLCLTGKTSPHGSNLEDLNALTRDPEPEVELRPNVRRRPPTFDKGADHLSDARSFEFTKGHQTDVDRLS